jgi:DNA-binding NarL/FixJ family response regulator
MARVAVRERLPGGRSGAGRRRFVSEAMVKAHPNHVLAKLTMQDRAALIARTWRHGLASR